jgi:hypothetical protein
MVHIDGTVAERCRRAVPTRVVPALAVESSLVFELFDALVQLFAYQPCGLSLRLGGFEQDLGVLSKLCG